MKVGTLVECVNGSFEPRQRKYLPNRPSTGGHYFIRAIIEYSHGVGVLLEELHNPPIDSEEYGVVEPSFNIERFREIEGLDDAVDELMESIVTQEA